MATTAMAPVGTPLPGSDDRAFLGHPKGLAYLAFTEAWERFSYYGMTALVVLYMVQELLLPGHVENVAGMAGYHYTEGMSWLDAFANAAMIASGMGPLAPLATVGGKLFAGFYALFCGIVLIAAAGLILTPVFHRALHTLHIDDDGEA